MDLRQLRYFVAVAEEGHFGRAAQRLHIVQPALSMQIRALEEDIGGLLFLRTSRSVQLTEAGALLLIEARRTLAQAERAKSIVQESLRGEVGSVKIGFAGNALLTGRLIKDLRDFHRLYPAVQIVLREMAPGLQGEAIIVGELDIGYSPSIDLVIAPQLLARKIGEWPFIVAMNEDHVLAKKKCISLASLANEALILYATGEGDGGLGHLNQRLGTTLNASLQVASTLSVLALAAAGIGLALVPAPLDAVTIPHLVYRPIAEKDRLADLLLLNRANETNSAVKVFLKFALQQR